jgi:hypothetical protein
VAAQVRYPCVFEQQPNGAWSIDCTPESPLPTPEPTPTATLAPTLEPTLEPTATPEPTATLPTSPLPTPTPTQPTSPLPTPSFEPNGKRIAANADDVHEWQRGIVPSAWPAWVGWWDGYSEQVGYRFVNMDIGGPVARATLWVYGTHSSSSDLTVEVYAVNLGNAPAWIDGSSVLSLPLTSRVTFVSSLTAGQWNAIDVTGQVVEVTESPDWRAGNALAFVFVNGSKTQSVAGLVDFVANPAQAARLDVQPLNIQAAAVPEPPAEFGRHQIDAALAPSGLALEPGKYWCDGDPYSDAWTSCKIYTDEYTICASGEPLTLERCE